MTAALRDMGGKYANALDGDRYASFNLIGTSSWEDYASATLTAMALESISDLDERVGRMEVLLTEIRDLLAEGRDASRQRKPKSVAVARRNLDNDLRTCQAVEFEVDRFR